MFFEHAFRQQNVFVCRCGPTLAMVVEWVVFNPFNLLHIRIYDNR